MDKTQARKNKPKPAPQKIEKREGKKTSSSVDEKVEEIGGREGPDPTRYGDWENKGILSDF